MKDPNSKKNKNIDDKKQITKFDFSLEKQPFCDQQINIRYLLPKKKSLDKTNNKEKESKINDYNEYNKKIENNCPSPENIQFLFDIVKDSFTLIISNNTFCIFKSINGILYLIYSNENKSIIAYDLIHNKKINEIKNSHEKDIQNFRHFFDIINRRDLLMSISKQNNIKVWDIYNFECILSLNNINKHGLIFSACFLNDDNQIYIATSSYTSQLYSHHEPIKLFDFKKNKIKEINNSYDNTHYIFCYDDKVLSKKFIITGNAGHVKSYDYALNKVYHKYDCKDNAYSHLSIIINDKKPIKELIESCGDGYIRIWDFHSGILLNLIKASSFGINSICLWNNKYLFISSDNKIILVDIINSKIIKEFTEHKNSVLTIKKINLPNYGECLISQGWSSDDNIKLWAIKK